MTEIVDTFNVQTEDEFRAMMEAIDDELKSGGLSVEKRPMRAWLTISGRRGLGLDLFPEKTAPESGSYAGDDLTLRIFNWYEERYGEQIEIYFGPGSTILEIRGDPYRVWLPRVFGGAVRFIADPATHGHDVHPKMTHGGQVATVNVLDCIEGLQPGLSKELSEQELQWLASDIHRLTLEFNSIETLFEKGFGPQAQTDLEASIDCVLRRPPEYGVSRWNSLQAVEKFLKTYLQEKGRSFPKGRDGHDLHKLAALANDVCCGGLLPGMLNAVQCGTGVRYGEEPSTREQAVLAHKMAGLICWKIARTLEMQPLDAA